MKRIWKFSETAKTGLLLRTTLKTSSKTPIHSPPNLLNTSPSYRFTKHTSSCYTSTTTNALPTLLHLFTETKGYELKDILISNQSDPEKITEILESKISTLIPTAFVLLLRELKPCPELALQVFNWKRRSFLLVAEEYAAGITIAGRLKNVDLAAALFSEAYVHGVKSTVIYNALMGAYMYNDLSTKAQKLFRELKEETTCLPDIVTYNILLAMYGRLVLVDQMETTLKEIQDFNLTPNSNTYNHVIAGYLTAWMWEDMERMYITMEGSLTKPNLYTHLLKLRGYAHSGNLEKMETTYRTIKCLVDEVPPPSVRSMICAYCKSSDKGRVVKVEALLKLVPEEDYRPWLNVLLIRLYAQEDLLDKMESFITQAVEHNTSVGTMTIMRTIITAYFRSNAVERLSNFIKVAEASDWRICRSLYHCKMSMYSSMNRLDEMESVLEEMQEYNIFPTKKTFMLMYDAYLKWAQRSRAEKLLGTMYKHGIEFPQCLPS